MVAKIASMRTIRALPMIRIAVVEMGRPVNLTRPVATPGSPG
jgi:hypothetical protein